MTRDEYRSRVLDIAAKASARRLDEFNLPNGDLMMVFWPGHYSKAAGQVLVTIGEDYCYHYLQGGAKWVDLENDLGMPSGQ